MVRCEACGAPLLKTWSSGTGWALCCIDGCPPRPLEDPPAGEAAIEAAKQAASSLGWYTLEDAGDEAMDRAEACFHAVRQANPNDLALAWAELLCRFGVRWRGNKDEAAPLLLRKVLTSRRLFEEADFNRLLDLAAGTETLAWFKARAQRVDRLLDGAQAMQGEPGFDLFIALKTEEAGEATPEKQFCDALCDQLDRVFGVSRVFYAPRTLRGRTAEEFEPIIHRALQTARVLAVVAATEAHANAPWVRSEWMRFLGRGGGRVLVCRLRNLGADTLPAALTSAADVTVSEEDASVVASQLYRLLNEAPEAAKEDPESLYRRGRELLKLNPKRAVELLCQAAKEKHSAAQLLLGGCYERGVGVKANLKEARRWYLSAAGKGVSEARAALDALAVRADAERGVPSAQAALGRMYLKGENGLEPDPAAAAEWLRPAAEAGNPEAAFLYGCMLTEGHGVAADRRLGRRLLNLARTGGNQAAEAYLRGGRVPWKS